MSIVDLSLISASRMVDLVSNRVEAAALFRSDVKRLVMLHCAGIFFCQLSKRCLNVGFLPLSSSLQKQSTQLTDTEYSRPRQQFDNPSHAIYDVCIRIVEILEDFGS